MVDVVQTPLDYYVVKCNNSCMSFCFSNYVQCPYKYGYRTSVFE